MEYRNDCKLDAAPYEEGYVKMSFCSEPLRCLNCLNILDKLFTNEAELALEQLPTHANLTRVWFLIPPVKENVGMYSYDYLQRLVSRVVLNPDEETRAEITGANPVLNLYFTQNDIYEVPSIRVDIIMEGAISNKVLLAIKKDIQDHFNDFLIKVGYDFHFGRKRNEEYSKLFVKPLIVGLSNFRKLPIAERMGMSEMQMMEMDRLNGVKLKKLNNYEEIGGVLLFLEEDRVLIEDALPF